MTRARLSCYVLLNTVVLVTVPAGLWMLAKTGSAYGYAITSPRVVLNDVDLYWRWSSDLVSGKIPYRDFAYPYPPVSLLLLAAPRMLASSIGAFTFWYSLQTAAVNAVVVILVHRAAQNRAIDPHRAVWMYSAFLAPLACTVLWRMDIAIALMSFLGAMEWEAGRRRVSAAILASGAMLKVVPALVFGIECLGRARSERDWRSRASAVAVFAVLCLALSGLWLSAGGRGAVRLHADRGLEFGSTYAGVLLMWARATGQPLTVGYEQNCVCMQLFGFPAALPVIRGLSTGVTVTALGFVAFQVWRRQEHDLFEWSAAVLLIFIVTFKVLSPQYLVWCAPFIGLLSGAAARRVQWSFFASCVLTMAVFPLGFDYLIRKNDWWVIVLNLRNGLLVYCTLKLIIGGQEPRGVSNFRRADPVMR